MAVLDKSLEPKILEAAKAEFLKYGFEESSLREICKKAGVTTGALYKRYKGKDELFEAIIEDTLIDINKILELNLRLPIVSQNEKGEVIVDLLENGQNLKIIMDFIYLHYDGFRLLFYCAKGSRYEAFLHIFVDKSEEFVWEYIEKTIKEYDLCITVTKMELHLMLSSYWSAIFQPILHDFSKEEAINYSYKLSKLFEWKSIIAKATK